MFRRHPYKCDASPQEEQAGQQPGQAQPGAPKRFPRRSRCGFCCPARPGRDRAPGLTDVCVCAESEYEHDATAEDEDESEDEEARGKGVAGKKKRKQRDCAARTTAETASLTKIDSFFRPTAAATHSSSAPAAAGASSAEGSPLSLGSPAGLSPAGSSAPHLVPQLRLPLRKKASRLKFFVRVADLESSH